MTTRNSKQGIFRVYCSGRSAHSPNCRPYSIFKALFLCYCFLFALVPTLDRLLLNSSTGIRRDYLEFSGS
nr:unnamed protein product [Haemonchus contortus]